MVWVPERERFRSDVMIWPRLSQIALLDFHRAAESIAEGQRAVEQVLPEISEMVASRTRPPVPARPHGTGRKGEPS